MERRIKYYLRRIGYDRVTIVQSRRGAYILARDKRSFKTYKFSVQTLVAEMVKRKVF